MEHKDRREKATQKRREDGIHNGKRNKREGTTEKERLCDFYY
jgi:hypothetical protein